MRQDPLLCVRRYGLLRDNKNHHATNVDNFYNQAKSSTQQSIRREDMVYKI
ncbi:hypothetical protein OROGR_026651 [Orobanche gracilis]